MKVSILKQRDYLIASIQAALTDEDLKHLRDALVTQVGEYRSRGVIIDVTALDVMDSFAVRTLRDLAHMTRLRGAETVIVGIQPEVAFAMTQLGVRLEDRKSTRLNSSHVKISYAVFCLKKKKTM